MTQRCLILSTFGERVRLSGRCVKITHKDKPDRLVSLDELHTIILPRRGISVSCDVISAAISQGIDIHFMSPNGRPFAALVHPALNLSVMTRRAQLRIADSEAGTDLGAALIYGKIRHQRGLIRGLARRFPAHQTALTQHAEVMSTALSSLKSMSSGLLNAIRPELMGIEGAAGRVYWLAIAHVIDEVWGFAGRRHRGEATDPFNAALNYGYGILQTRVTSALVRAGIDPHAGWVHVDRPGRPSMVLDVMEPWRQPIVDRPLLGLLGRRKTPWALDDDGLLTPEARQAVAGAVLRRLDTQVEYGDRRWPLQAVIQHEARALAAAIRGERRWRPWSCKM